jgi:DNA-binding MarR family transcriptional regulator
MVKVMNYLVNCGYIKRQRNPADKREHLVMLTARGLESTKAVVKKFDQLDKKLFSKLSPSDKNALESLLEKLTAELKSLPANDLFFSYTANKMKQKK